MNDLGGLARNVILAALNHALGIVPGYGRQIGNASPHGDAPAATKDAGGAGANRRPERASCGTASVVIFDHPTVTPPPMLTEASIDGAEDVGGRIAASAGAALARFIDDPRLTDRHVDDHIARLTRLENRKRADRGLAPVPGPARRQVLRLAHQVAAMGTSERANPFDIVPRSARAYQRAGASHDVDVIRSFRRDDLTAAARAERVLLVRDRHAWAAHGIEPAIDSGLAGLDPPLSQIVQAVRLAERAENARRRTDGRAPLRGLSENAIHDRLRARRSFG